MNDVIYYFIDTINFCFIVYKREIVEEESVTTQVEKAEDSKKTDDAIEEVSADFLLNNDNQAVIISVPSVTNEYEEEYDEEDIEVKIKPLFTGVALVEVNNINTTRISSWRRLLALQHL